MCDEVTLQSQKVQPSEHVCMYGECINNGEPLHPPCGHLHQPCCCMSTRNTPMVVERGTRCTISCTIPRLHLMLLRIMAIQSTSIMLSYSVYSERATTCDLEKRHLVQCSVYVFMWGWCAFPPVCAHIFVQPTSSRPPRVTGIPLIDAKMASQACSDQRCMWFHKRQHCQQIFVECCITAASALLPMSEMMPATVHLPWQLLSSCSHALDHATLLPFMPPSLLHACMQAHTRRRQRRGHRQCTLGSRP